MDFVLYHSPGACSRTQLILLEQAGAAYELRIVRIPAGENSKPDFLRLNPKGKVPVLVHQGRAITENIAIATYLARQFPQAGLMPLLADAVAYTEALTWLSYVATGLHPTIFRARMAQRVVDGEAAQASVKAKALVDLHNQFKVAEERLQGNDWLAGARWCAPDAYFYWATTRATEAGVDLADLPRVRDHHARMHAQDAVQGMLTAEQEAIGRLPMN